MNGSLVFDFLQPDHAGWYLCQASNGVGPVLSKAVRVQVHGKQYFIELSLWWSNLSQVTSTVLFSFLWWKENLGKNYSIYNRFLMYLLHKTDKVMPTPHSWGAAGVHSWCGDYGSWSLGHLEVWGERRPSSQHLLGTPGHANGFGNSVSCSKKSYIKTF